MHASAHAASELTEAVRARREEPGLSQRQRGERPGMAQIGVARFDVGGTTRRGRC
jgi:hypothetical protein